MQLIALRLRRLPTLAVFLSAAAAATAPAAAQGGIDLDTVRAGRFDMGRMWTFEYAPRQYFSETYGFPADDDWFDRARLSVLRIPGCSASFVSPNGLVVTNHHCVRNAIVQVTQPGESLLDDGFYADAVTGERRIPNYYADQLLAVQDVSAEVFAAIDAAATDAARAAARQEVLARIEQRLRQQHAAAGATHV
jgi:S1-C subfamily serine protease